MFRKSAVTPGDSKEESIELRSRELKGHTAQVISVTYRSDGRELASGSEDKTIRLWNVETGSLLKELRGHTREVLSVTYRPDGRELASGSYDQTIRLWQLGEISKEQPGGTPAPPAGAPSMA